MRYDSSGKWILVGRYWIRLSDGRRLPVIQGATQPSTVQNRFAFGDDDGSESGHSLDTENADRTAQVADVTFLIRIQIEEVNGKADPWDFILRAAKNGGSYTDVTTARIDGIRLANDTQSRADNQVTTERLTAGAGSWKAGYYDDGTVEDGMGSTLSLLSQYSDLEFAIEIDSGNAANNDYWDLEVYDQIGTALDGYTETPRVTADISEPVLVNLGVGSLSANGQQLDVVPGAATISLGAGSLSSNGQALDVVPGIASISLGIGALAANGQQLDIIPGLATISLAVGALAAGGQQLDVIPGLVSVSLGVGALAANGQTLTAKLLTVVQLGVGSLSANGQQLNAYSWRSYLDKVLGIGAGDIIGLWPLNEQTGSNADDKSPENNDGVYTGVDLANAIGPDGLWMPWFDGSNDYVDIYSAGLNADFDGAECTIDIWIKVNGIGVWTDGIQRLIVRIHSADANFYTIRKSTANDTIYFSSYDGTVNSQANYNFGGGGPTGLIHLTITRSELADEVKFYVDGVQVSTTKTGLGTWTGALLSNAIYIGAYNSAPIQVWHGWLAHAHIFTKALAPDQIAKLADPGNPWIVMNAGQLVANGQVLDVKPGLVSIPLGIGQLAANGQQAIIDSGALVVNLGVGQLTAGGQTLTVLAHQTIILAVGSLSSNGQQLTVTAQPPGVQVNLSVGQISTNGQALTVLAHQSISLGIGSLSANGQALNVIPGLVVISLQVGQLTANGQQLTVDAGGILLVNLGVGQMSANGQALAVIPGLALISLQVGSLGANGQILNVLPGTVTIGLAVGALVINGQTLVTVLTVHPDPGKVYYSHYREKRSFALFDNKSGPVGPNEKRRL